MPGTNTLGAHWKPDWAIADWGGDLFLTLRERVKEKEKREKKSITHAKEGEIGETTSTVDDDENNDGNKKQWWENDN